MSITSERIREQPFFHALADDAAEEIETLEKELDQFRAENEKLKAELKSIDGALDDPRANLTLTTAEIIWEIKAELAEAKKDAERWKYARRKICFTGNGDGTCMMHGINLPAAIPGWPDPGKVEEFCDAAIDAAMKGK